MFLFLLIPYNIQIEWVKYCVLQWGKLWNIIKSWKCYILEYFQYFNGGLDYYLERITAVDSVIELSWGEGEEKISALIFENFEFPAFES